MVKQRRGVRMAVLLACVATTIAMTVVDASARTVPIFTRNGPVGDCPHAGHLTYTLDRVARPTAEQAAAYRAIGTAMDQALAVYNCHSDLTRSLWVSYDPAVPTADGSDNGSIRFGAHATMQQITAMHEIGHTLGVGTSPNWAAHLAQGRWTGSHATEQLRRLTGRPDAQLFADRQHFWPYGLNQVNEVDSADDLAAHVQLVVALRRDMGL